MKHHPDIRMKLTSPSDIKFICEAFHNGTSKAKCKIWISYPSYSNPQIGYSDSFFSFEQDNSFNEILSISDSPYAFGLQSLMRVGWESHFEHMNFTNLSSEQAAEYLWRRFVSALER